MDLSIVVLAYSAIAVVVLAFLLTALRGARRIDEQQDRELVDALMARRDSARRTDPLPPLRAGESADPLPALPEDQGTKQPR